MDIKEIVNLVDTYQKGQLTNDQLKLVKEGQFDNIDLSSNVGGSEYDIDDYSPEIHDLVEGSDMLDDIQKRVRLVKKIIQAKRKAGIPVKHTVKLMEGIITSVDDLFSDRLDKNISNTKRMIIEGLKKQLQDKANRQERFKQKDVKQLTDKFDDIEGLVIKEDEYEDSKRETKTEATREPTQENQGQSITGNQQEPGNITGGLGQEPLS
jgi:hypothetical protein